MHMVLRQMECLQRMCDDVPAFTDASVTLVIGIVKKFFMMIGFSGAPLNSKTMHMRMKGCQALTSC